MMSKAQTIKDEIMGSGFAKMKKQARMFEQQVEKMREEMQKVEVAGSAGNGLVTVILNGEKEMKQISIKPECVDPSDIEGLQDLIKAAYMDAFAKANELSNAGMPGMPNLF